MNRVILLMLLLVMEGCSGLELRARIGPPVVSRPAPASVLTTRVVVLSAGASGWPDVVRGATVRALDVGAGILRSETTGPGGNAVFAGHGPMLLWVSIDGVPRPIPWHPVPDPTSVNGQVIVVRVQQ